MNKFKFGQKVKVLAKMVRYRNHENRKNSYGREFSVKAKYWVKREITKVNGIFLGYRTLYNGYVDEIIDEGLIFISESHFQVALVACSPNKNPVYVPLDSIEEIEILLLEAIVKI